MNQKILLLILCCIGLGSTASAQGENLLLNGDFSRIANGRPAGWTGSGEVTAFANADGQGGIVRLGAGGRIEQSVKILPDWWKLKVSCRLKVDDVVRGAQDWQTARLALRFTDATGKRVGPYPPVIGVVGTRDWQDYSRSIIVPEGAAFLIVEPAMFGVSGVVEFASVSVSVESLTPVPEDMPLPAEAVEANAIVWKEVSQTRERISLNGMWQFYPLFEGEPEDMPETGSGWGWFKVPGIWPPWERNQAIHLSGWKTLQMEARGQKLDNLVAGWYRRQLSIPADWNGGTVSIDFEGVQTRAVVYIGEQKVATVDWPGGVCDISDYITAGETVTLSVFVNTALDGNGMAGYRRQDSELGDGEPVQIINFARMRNRGLVGDVYLDYAANGQIIEDVLVLPSVREGTLGVDVGFSKGVRAQRGSRLVATVLDGGEVVHTVQSHPLEASDVVDGRVRFAQPWAEPQLWSPETPHLYQLRVALVSPDGTVQDETTPVTFGFREFWVQGKDFYLNGNPVRLRLLQIKNNENPADHASFEGGQVVARRLREYGFNAAITHNYGFRPGNTSYLRGIYQAADAEGLLLTFVLPRGGDFAWELEHPQVSEHYRRLTQWLVRRYQNHPSIIAYATNHNTTANIGAKAPERLDGIYRPEEDPGSEMSAALIERRRQAEQIMNPFIRGLDPSRPIYSHSSGNLGDMVTLNLYRNWAPIRERANWLRYWAQNGAKPLMFVENGMPHTASWSNYRGPHFIYSGAHKLSIMDSEYSAAIIGEQAYEMTPEKIRSLEFELGFWDRGEKVHWDSLIRHFVRDTRNYLGVQAKFIEQELPALRTWGISGNLFWDQRFYWIRTEPTPSSPWPRQWETLTAPGITPDRRGSGWEFIYESQDGYYEATPVANALKRWNMPQLGYLAGANGIFTERDHNFLPGETVPKQLIVINDGFSPVTCNYSWSFAATGASGSGELVLQPGQQQHVPFHVHLPDTMQPGNYQLEAKFDFAGHGVQEDSFVIDVLPLPAQVAAQRPIVLLDPGTQTADYLTKLGFRYRHVRSVADLPSGKALIDEGALLVIGHHALDGEENVPQFAAVQDGLNILLFEQEADVLQRLTGFRTNEWSARNVFVRNNNSVVFNGLGEAHLHNWRGSAAERPKMGERYGQPQIEWLGFTASRVWRAGEEGTVASVLIEKPSVGDFMAFIDCGFDLQYSPLMQWNSGKGSVLFCQMSLIGRSEEDPAAQQLARNIIDYMAAPDKPEPRAVLYSGGAQGAALLDNLDIRYRDYDGGHVAGNTLLVVTPQTALDASLLGQVQAGMNVLALGLDAEQIEALFPGQFSARQRKMASRLLPEDVTGTLQGLSSAETYWRTFPELTAVGDAGSEPEEALLVRQFGKGTVVLSQAAPWDFDPQGRPYLRTTQRRSHYLVSRLLHNMGAAGSNRLADLAVRASVDRPKPWLNTHYVQEPVAGDDPYRFYGW